MSKEVQLYEWFSVAIMTEAKKKNKREETEKTSTTVDKGTCMFSVI